MSLHVCPTFWNDVRYRVQLAGGLWGEDLRDRGSSFKEIAFERADPSESQALGTGSTSVNQEPSSPRRMGEPYAGREERREYSRSKPGK